ncbi:uncharacterized protein [Ranitomeya imitator]|uniref:uncharacterized protein n=1 Tax=Ranitomeya imitator TaxID=111125 RepID=UPI0037E86CC7
MSEVYRISSSDKIQFLEKQLESQLSELKTEIEENGVLHGTPSRAYTSVPIPKDIAYYRNEREMILKRGLQVAGAKPITVQADVMQRELETCLTREYTADNLPLLLHQFFTDRIHQLVRSKYLHMLRWKRFCRHTSVMEQCYPQYKEQVGYIMQEYADSVQRAQRLSIARERLLTGQKNSINLVTQDDLMIYMQWIICHLHSVKPIYSYIRILQYLPISDRAVEVIESQLKDRENHPSIDVGCTTSSDGRPEESDLRQREDSELPEHQIETEQIKPILRQLLSTYKIGYDTEQLKNTANEMELLTLVSAKFRSTFIRQKTMNTFPLYDSGMETNDGWGFRGPHMAFKKIANWLPFVKIKPKKDPWQQKFLTKLKQHKKVDELLRQSQFTEVTNAEKAMEVLQEHAAWVLQPQKNKPEIWGKRISTPELSWDQNTNAGLSIQQTTNIKISDIASLSKRPASSKTKKETGYNYQNTLQLLGLDEAEDNSKDPVLMKGAYLSLLYLRHLRLRDLQRMCLGILNYFRSIERTLTIDSCGLCSTSGHLAHSVGEQACWVNATQGGSGMNGGLGSHQYMYQTPADLQVHSAEFMEFSEVENHNDFYTVEDGIIHTQDQRGAYVMYDAALEDFKHLQEQMLLLTTLYIEKDQSFKLGKQELEDTNLSDWAHVNVDRFALLLELWTWECALLENKQQLVDSYYEAYQHTLDPEERFSLAQVITDIMYKRPRFDIGSKYFLEAYSDECQCLRLHLQLVRDVLTSQKVQPHTVTGISLLQACFTRQCLRTGDPFYDLEPKLCYIVIGFFKMKGEREPQFPTSNRGFMEAEVDNNTHDLCIDLLNLVLRENFFLFEDDFFVQTCGTAMGSNVAPAYANLYMDHFEREQGNHTSLQEFHNNINTARPELSFTLAFHDNEVTFLDTKVLKDALGNLNTDLYSKPTDCNSLLLYNSCHPKSTKDSLPRSQFKRLENQRQFVQKVWRESRKGGAYDFGLPHNIVTKPLVSLNTSCPALKNVYLFEFHPSLGLAFLISCTLDHICKEFQHLCNSKSPKQSYIVEKRVLQLALREWLAPKDLLKSFTANVHKDLFEEVLIEDPVMVRDICMSALNSADEDKKHGRGKQIHIQDTFSKMLQLITLRYRIIEASLETAFLSRTYTQFAEEMGFNQFHLFIRPVQFEFASHKGHEEQKPPMFITSLIEDDSCVDRYLPSSQLLAIHEVDDNQIGKFSFLTREGIMQLLNKCGAENMQVVLACQVSQKNALLAANQLASFCYLSSWTSLDMKDENLAIQRQISSSASARSSTSWAIVESLTSISPVTHSNEILVQARQSNKRLPEAFVSIQLEKVGPRDTMLNAFLLKKQAMGTALRNPEEVEKVKRELVTDYCQKLTRRISTYSLRGQIIAYCNSLKLLLEEFPLICKTYFTIGRPQGRKTITKEAPQADPRIFQERPHTLLSDDGRIFVNLWYIPYSSEVLSMFQMLPEKAAYRALYQTLQIIAALHDIVSFVLSFAQLGNSCSGFGSVLNRDLTADWGGTEGIGAELQDLQKLIDGLHSPNDPKEVAALLLLRREVMILQFDAAVRYLIREALLSSGDISAFRTITDNMCHGLTALSNSVVKSAFSSQLSVPQPHDPRSHRAFLLYPWRTFLADGGLFPLAVNGLHAIGYHMQLCLCDMSDQERSVAHGELVGVHLLMEDILQEKYRFSSFNVEGNLETKQLQTELFPLGEKQSLKIESKLESEAQDPVSESTLLKSFLILWKQLEYFKEQWGKHKLQVEEIDTVGLYRQFCELYRDEIFYPTMKALAWQMGKEEEFEGLTLRSQLVLPPKGASEIEVRVRQLQKMMESFESDMIYDVQRKIAKEMTLVISERTREGRGVPTELWKKPVMKENFSPGRPQIVEKFVQQLMSEHRGNSAEITFRQEHLESCLTLLACAIMAREQSNFESYSMFYENLLQQEQQNLYQKEQELLASKQEQNKTKTVYNENTDMSHELIIEITALRARLQDIEEEMMSSKETIKKQVQDEYEALIRTLFAASVSLKSRIDDYHISMNQQVTEIISDVRKEGVDDMISLKKKYYPGQNGSTLKDTLSMQEKIQNLREENSQLRSLVCKLKALNKWKITAKEGQLREKLRNTEKEAIQNKKEGLKLKLLVETEVALLRQQLVAARTALTRTQAEASKVGQQLSRQKQLLNESEHRQSQETKKRQQLDNIKSASMDKLMGDIEDKEHRLRSLTEETERASKMGLLQESKIRKEVKQIKSQLLQERSLKLDAFQRVDELQSQVYDMETATSLRTYSGGIRKTSGSLRSRTSRSQSAAPTFMSSEILSCNQEIWDPLQYFPSTEAKSLIHGERRLQRPKTVPSRCRAPERADSTSQAILTQLQELRLSTK